MKNYKKILCFGDSNTYGFNPNNFKRYNEKERWSGILKKHFDNKYIIKENGCNNRCGFNDNEIHELNGALCLSEELKNKYDIIIIQLGINDTQIKYNSNEDKIVSGIEKLANIIKDKNPNAKTIFLCPNAIDNCILNSYFSSLFDNNSINLSCKYEKIYKNICEKHNFILINLNDIAQTSKIDGLHYDTENHKKIAQHIIQLLK